MRFSSRLLFVPLLLIFSCAVTACRSQWVPDSASGLDPESYRVQVVGKESATYEHVVTTSRGDADDTLIEMRGMQIMTGSAGFKLSIAIPDGTAPGTYTMCSMRLYRSGQCAIGVAYQRTDDTLPTDATSYGPASITLESVDPYSGTFEIEASFPDGSDKVIGAFMAPAIED